jgi:hypothetical protein
MESMSMLPVVFFAMSTSLVIVAHGAENVVLLESSESPATTDICTSTCDAEEEMDHSDLPVDPVASDHCQVYLFSEWTSSTGLLFSVFLLYLSLVTITNIVVVYKFIATWNQITLSLREQNRVCAKYSQFKTTRRLTCPEALPPSRYQASSSASIACCPICLIDIQDQEYVASCDGGCATVFHKDCIYEWLDYKQAERDLLSAENHTCCPCCRKELLGITSVDPTAGKSPTSSSGFVSDLSTLVGYYPY